MKSRAVLNHELLPTSSIALGRFVTDIQNPQRRFHDLPFELNARQAGQTVQQNFQEIRTRARNVALEARLTELLSAFRRKGVANETSVAAPWSVTYYLLQWDDLFKDACTANSTRKWIQNVIEDGFPVYFIVGYRTFVNPSVRELGSSKSGHGASAQIPASTVVAANVSPGLQLGSALDPGLAKEAEVSTSGARSFFVNAEMVYAVQYCKVVFKWHSSRELDRSFLGKTKWRLHWGVRGVEEAGEDDVVEVELTIDSDKEDLLDIET